MREHVTATARTLVTGRWYTLPDGTRVRARVDKWCTELPTVADLVQHVVPDLYTSGDMIMSCGNYTGWTVTDLVEVS